VKDKVLPSGEAPNVIYALPEKYGGENRLLAVPKEVVAELMEAVGGKSLIEFVTPEYEAEAWAIFRELGHDEITYTNIWDIFHAMLPKMREKNLSC